MQRQNLVHLFGSVFYSLAAGSKQNTKGPPLVKGDTGLAFSLDVTVALFCAWLVGVMVLSPGVAFAQGDFSRGHLNDLAPSAELNLHLKANWTLAPQAVDAGSGTNAVTKDGNNVYTFTYSNGADTLTYTWAPTTGSTTLEDIGSTLVGSYRGRNFKPVDGLRVSNSTWENLAGTCTGGMSQCTPTQCTTDTQSAAVIAQTTGGVLISCDNSQMTASKVLKCDFRPHCDSTVVGPDNTFSLFVGLIGKTLVLEFTPRLDAAATYSGNLCTDDSTCNNNNTCDAGEDPTNCPNDCTGGGTCNNNNTCDAGEYPTNCPTDCTGPQPSQYFWHEPDCAPTNDGLRFVSPGRYLGLDAGDTVTPFHLPYSDQMAMGVHQGTSGETIAVTAFWDFVASQSTRGPGDSSIYYKMTTNDSEAVRLTTQNNGSSMRERLLISVSNDAAEVFPRSPFTPSPYRAAMGRVMSFEDWDDYSYLTAAPPNEPDDFPGYGCEQEQCEDVNNSCNTTGHEYGYHQRLGPLVRGGVQNLHYVRHTWRDLPVQNTDTTNPAAETKGGSCGLGKLGTLVEGLNTSLGLDPSTPSSWTDKGVYFSLHADYEVGSVCKSPCLAASMWDCTSTSQPSCDPGGDGIIDSPFPAPSCASASCQEPWLKQEFKTTASFIDVSTATVPVESSGVGASDRYHYALELVRQTKNAHEGPVFGEGGNVNLRYAGPTDVINGEFSNVNRNYYNLESLGEGPFWGQAADLIPDFKLRELHNQAVFAGVGYEGRWFNDVAGNCYAGTGIIGAYDNCWNVANRTQKRAVQILFGNQVAVGDGFFGLPGNGGPITEYHALMPVQQYYLSEKAAVEDIRYLVTTGTPAQGYTLLEAMAADYNFGPGDTTDGLQVSTTWNNGLKTWVNLSQSLLPIPLGGGGASAAATRICLPQNGYLAYRSNDLLAFYGRLRKDGTQGDGSSQSDCSGDNQDPYTITWDKNRLFMEAFTNVIDVREDFGILTSQAALIEPIASNTLDILPMGSAPGGLYIASDGIPGESPAIVGPTAQWQYLTVRPLHFLQNTPHISDVRAIDVDGNDIGSASFAIDGADVQLFGPIGTLGPCDGGCPSGSVCFDNTGDGGTDQGCVLEQLTNTYRFQIILEQTSGQGLCNDNDPCTTDFRDPADPNTCYSYLSLSNTCAINGACAGEFCLGGKCASLPVECVDGQSCTDGVCGISTGSCADKCGAVGGSCDCDAECVYRDTCCSDICSECPATNVPGCCIPYCTGKVCGIDGCGGSCGGCPGQVVCSSAGRCFGEGDCCGNNGTPGCSDETVQDCVCVSGGGPDLGCCQNTVNWDGQCATNATTNCNLTCGCTSNCNGKVCGADGCGGSCGDCPGGQSCNNGTCEAAGSECTMAANCSPLEVDCVEGRCIGTGDCCSNNGTPGCTNEAVQDCVCAIDEGCCQNAVTWDGSCVTLANDSCSANCGGGTSCAENEYVSSNACVACAAGSTNAAGDDPASDDTACDPTLCAVNEYVSSNTCVACAAGSTNAADDNATNGDTTCDAALCRVNEYVSSKTCVTCPAGSTNAANDDATGGDTTCDATLCPVNEYVSSNACVTCAAGSTNAANDNATDGDTTCDATLCGVNKYVSSNACVTCAAGSTNAANDNATDGDTTCDATLCGVNEYVSSNVCVTCPAGSTNAANDNATDGDTTCDATLCGVNEYVASHTCVPCSGGDTNTAGDNTASGDTVCDGNICPTNQHVSSNTCVPCAAGSSNAAGDDPTDVNTTCDATLCDVNDYVSSNICVTCAAGSTNAANDNAAGGDTTCDATLCPVNEYVSSNTCITCAAGSTNAANDNATGGDTTCDVTLCPVNEYVSSNTCVPCATGTTNAAGDNATDGDTSCEGPCTANCSGNTCGGDGCGESCGDCSTGQACNNGNCETVCTPNCTQHECGNDGCSGSCGDCSTGQGCVDGVCTDEPEPDTEDKDETSSEKSSSGCAALPNNAGGWFLLLGWGWRRRLGRKTN
jgi:hypothetical protein